MLTTKATNTEQQIQRILRDASHDQVRELADFLQRHPFIPASEFLEFVQKHWGAPTKSEHQPHHNKSRSAHT